MIQFVKPILIPLWMKLSAYQVSGIKNYLTERRKVRIRPVNNDTRALKFINLCGQKNLIHRLSCFFSYQLDCGDRCIDIRTDI